MPGAVFGARAPAGRGSARAAAAMASESSRVTEPTPA